ncbi:MAG: hypothetical protein AB1498_00305, partial [bacterium]
EHNGKITTIRIESAYEFEEDTTWNVTLELYAGDTTLTGQLLDYETLQFTNLPVSSVDANTGYNSTNLIINGIDDRIEFIIKNTAQDGYLSGQYTLKALINKDGFETTLGPVSFNVDKCVAPLSGDTHGPFKITALDRTGICCEGIQEPAIILNNYGNGKTVAFTFDLVESNNDTTFNKIKELILNSIDYTTPQTNPVHPMATLPVKIDIQNRGKEINLNVREIVPLDLTITDIFNGGIKNNNEITWQFNLAENAEKDLKYYGLMPDNTMQYNLLTEINYLDYDSTWKLYNNYPLEISNTRTTAGLIQEITDELNSMNLSPEDREKADEIIQKLERIRTRAIETRKDLEKNIEGTLKAIDKLADIQIANTTSVHLKLDELLKVYEARWSRWGE